MSNSITKENLISSMAELSGLTKVDTTRALTAFIQAVEQALKADKEVRLTGFGTFSVAKRPARTGRNPRTGEAIKIAASKSPKFKAGNVLKKAIV